jgi:hypothetical protein
MKKPRRKKPPIEPRRPDQIVRNTISPEQERLIGQAIAAWSRLDDALQEAIWHFLRLSMEDGRIVTARLDTKYKLNILRGLGQRHLDVEKFNDLSNLLGTIQDLYVDRNFIAHGKWVTLLPQNVPAATSLREKVDKIFDQADVIAETFPKDRMQVIIREIVISMNAIIQIIQEHATLRDSASDTQ